MKKSQKPHPHKPHAIPVTRRQFLAAGLLEFSGLMMAPTLANLLMPSEAKAEDLLPAFGVLDMAGGMAFPRNFMVGNQGGPDDRLTSYYELGLGGTAPANIAVNRAFGLPMPTSSPFLAGLLEQTSADTRPRIRIGFFCHKSVDDTPSNQTSAILLVSRLLQGSHVKTGLGNRPSASGGYTGVPEAVASLRPLTITRVDDILSAVRPQGPLSQVSPQAKQGWADAVKALMDAQGDSIKKRLLGETVLGLALSAAQKNQSVLNAAPQLDPRNDPVAQLVYGINPSTSPTAVAAINATIVMNSLKGNSGPFSLYFGGYDYHSGGFDDNPSEAVLDANIGRAVGRICEMARAYNRKVVLQLITDGGSNFGVAGGVYRATGDGGEKGMTIVVTFDPNGPIPMRRHQVGNYTNGQAADLKTVVGADEVKVAYGVFANYLNVIGRLGDFSRYGRILTPGELDNVLLFG